MKLEKTYGGSDSGKIRARLQFAGDGREGRFPYVKLWRAAR